ncbi:hypothetical protein Ancab_032840 [Ancistrocladus abbreviatus]
MCDPINGNLSTEGSSDKSDYFNDYSTGWKNDKDLGDAIIDVLNTQGKKGSGSPRRGSIGKLPNGSVNNDDGSIKDKAKHKEGPGCEKYNGLTSARLIENGPSSIELEKRYGPSSPCFKGSGSQTEGEHQALCKAFKLEIEEDRSRKNLEKRTKLVSVTIAPAKVSLTIELVDWKKMKDCGFDSSAKNMGCPLQIKYNQILKAQSGGMTYGELTMITLLTDSG